MATYEDSFAKKHNAKLKAKGIPAGFAMLGDKPSPKHKALKKRTTESHKRYNASGLDKRIKGDSY